jgi:RNA polymerase primary sigma factor
MANAARAEEQTAPQGEAHEKDAPLLDLSDAAVKRLIKTARARGFVTLDQLNAVLPSQEVSPDQIEDTMSMLSDMGITVVESEDAEEGSSADREDDTADDAEESARSLVAPSLPATSTARAEPTDRTDDPVRMYLREMGSVELLSREGEIAIAKRIEAGREAMIAGLCESPLTFQAIIIWRDELNSAKILLRDVIDLEATYEGPEAKSAPPPIAPPIGAPPAAPAAPAPAAGPAGDDAADGEPRPDGEIDDEDDFENAMSLAAMEAELKPKVLETFDKIADAYKRLRKLQASGRDARGERRISRQQRGLQAAGRGHRDVKSLSLNNARIEML